MPNIQQWKEISCHKKNVSTTAYFFSLLTLFYGQSIIERWAQSHTHTNTCCLTHFIGRNDQDDTYLFGCVCRALDKHFQIIRNLLSFWVKKYLYQHSIYKLCKCWYVWFCDIRLFVSLSPLYTSNSFVSDVDAILYLSLTREMRSIFWCVMCVKRES